MKCCSPSSVKSLPKRTNDSRLQLLCSSAAAKSFAALSVKLLLLRDSDSSLAKSFPSSSVKFFSPRTNDSNLQLLCLSAEAKSFVALLVKLLFLRSSIFSLQLPCLSAAEKCFAALAVKLLLLRYNDSSSLVVGEFVSLTIYPVYSYCAEVLQRNPSLPCL